MTEKTKDKGNGHGHGNDKHDADVVVVAVAEQEATGGAGGAGGDATANGGSATANGGNATSTQAVVFTFGDDTTIRYEVEIEKNAIKVHNKGDGDVVLVLDPDVFDIDQVAVNTGGDGGEATGGDGGEATGGDANGGDATNNAFTVTFDDVLV